MNAGTVLGFYFGVLLIIFGSGGWIAVVCTPQRLQEYKLTISFVFGLIWLILLSAWSSYLSFAFKESAGLSLVVSCLLSAAAMIVEIRKGLWRKWLPGKDQALALLLAFVSGLLVLIPYLIFKAPFTYGDGFTYICIADYLRDHSYFQPANPNPWFPWLTQMKLYQDGGFRMGAQFFLAFAGAVFRRTFSLEVYMPCVAAGQFCLVLGVWFFCRFGLSLPAKAAIAAVIFAAFHLSIPINNAIIGFYPQVFGMAILLVTFSLISKLETWKENRLSYVVLTAGAIGGLVLSYSELLPFFVLSLLPFTVLKILKYRSSGRAMLLNICAAGGLAVLLSNIALIKALHALKIQMNVVVGGNLAYSVWNYLTILFSLHLFYPNSFIANQYPVVYMLGIFAVVFGIYLVFEGFVCSVEWKDQKRKLLVLASSFLLVLIYSLFFATNPWQPGVKGHSWNIYKTVTYLFIFFPAIIGMSFAQFQQKNRLRRFLGSGVVIGYVFTSLVLNYFNAFNCTDRIRLYTGNDSNPVQEYYQLYNKLKSEQRPIYIITPPELIKHKQMIAYVLQKNKVAADWSDDDGYIYPYLLPENVSPPLKHDEVILVYNPNAADKTANMEILKSKVYLDFISGVYELEKNAAAAWHWSSGNAEIRALNLSTIPTEVTLKFKIGLAVNDSAKGFELYRDDIRQKEFKVQPNQLTACRFKVLLKPGKNLIRLKYLGEPVRLGADPRELAYQIQDFQYDINSKHAAKGGAGD